MCDTNSCVFQVAAIIESSSTVYSHPPIIPTTTMMNMDVNTQSVDSGSYYSETVTISNNGKNRPRQALINTISL